jgi:hypothetical protein
MMASERGLTIVELLVAVSAGVVVLLASFTMLNGVLRGSARTQQRVDANQRGRPVMTKIIDELHSVCVGPGVSPIIGANGNGWPASDDDTVTFLHRTGTDVQPNPDLRSISLSGGTLSETLYPYEDGPDPDYDFGPPQPNRLLTNVGNAVVDDTTVPVFRYFAYDASGTISATPLPTPLSATAAATVVKVTVAFSVSPSKTQVVEPGTDPSLTNTALFRFTPAAEEPSASNLPCT